MAIIKNSKQLELYLLSKGLSWDECQLPSADEFGGLFPMRIPEFYADLINWKDPSDPLRLMVIPSAQERDVKKYELEDPIGDKTHEPVPGLIHRYPDRCLLLFTTHCGVHCRFCFRRDVVGKVRPIDIQGIYKYLVKTPQIREVIFSGGDPATFPPEFFENVLTPLSEISHIKTIRVHTRGFVVDPTTFSQEWLKVFIGNNKSNMTIVLHINHPKEITSELAELVKQLRNSGVQVLSQSVLLKGVNDDKETLLRLFNSLSENGVKPYYLHHLDKAQGTHHFRISIEEGKKLYTSLRGQLSGYKLPEYVVDLPGGDGKVPVMWLTQKEKGVYEVENFEGKLITYIDPKG